MSRSKTITTAITSRIWINPPIVAPVTNPSSHKTNRTMAIVYNIKSSFGLFGLFTGWGEMPQPGTIICLLLGHRQTNGHVIDHAAHAVNVCHELADEAFFSFISGHATYGDDTIRG